MASCASLQGSSSVFELPYCKDGAVDWDTLGKILTANLLAEVVYASYVDKKHGLTSTDSFSADTDWEFDYTKDDIVVLKKRSERTFFLGRGVVDVPLKDVAEYVKDVRSTYSWDKLLVEAKYLKVLKQTDECTDYDGKFVQTAISIEDPDYPVHPDIIRVDARSGCGFVLEPYKGNASQTLCSYLGNVDLKRLPMFIMTRVLRTHPVCSIQALRKHFSKQQKHRSWLFPQSAQTELNPDRHSLSLSRSKMYCDVLPVDHFLHKEVDLTSDGES